MKKLAVLMLSAGLLLGAANAEAVDFKVKGSFQFVMDYVNGGNFMGKTRDGHHVQGQQWAPSRQQRDEFESVQRVHVQIEAVASESLSGMLFLEIGEQRWGYGSQGGAMGADGNQVKIKRAYVDWTVPNTDLSLRMGIIGIRMPGFSIDSPILDTDLAGVTASYHFNENVSLGAGWLRLYNDNFTGYSDKRNASYMDNFDLGFLTLPITTDGVAVTPWFMGGSMGPNTLRAGGKNEDIYSFQNYSIQGLDGLSARYGLFPAAYSTSRSNKWLTQYSTMFWGGITTKITAFDPFIFSADFIYGNVDNGYKALSRSGWFGMLVAEYKLDWATPGIYGWYFSGDDNNPHNGSEALPYLATSNNLNNSLSTFGYRGNPLVGGGKGVLGMNPNGTWGVGARLKRMSFLEDLTHTLRLHYFGGTHAPGMAKYITGRTTLDGSGRGVTRNYKDFNIFGTYLTTKDQGVEVNFDTQYKIYENLRVDLELGYIHLWLDKDTWGGYENYVGNTLNTKDAWKATVNVIYTF